ncbi:MAG: hypothetical protein ABI743_07055, partial [bacterium]
YGLAVDSGNNVYATGYFSNAVDFGTGFINPTGGGADGYLVKYNSSQALVYLKQFGGPGDETPLDLRLDSAERPIIMGNSTSPSFTFNGGPATPASPFFVVRYTAAGTFDWQYVKAAGGGNSGTAYSLCNIPTGGLAIAGNFSTAVDFGGGLRTPLGTQDIAVLKLNESGVYQWDYTAGAVGADNCFAVAAQSSGAVWACGQFTGTVNFGGTPKTAVNQGDIFLVTLNPSGTQTAVTTFGSSGFDYAYGLAVNAADEVFMSGNQGGPFALGGGPTSTNGLFLVKYDNAGAYVWHHGWAAYNGGQTYNVLVAPGGDLVVGGSYSGTAVDFEPGPGVTAYSVVGGFGFDAYAMRVQADGTW